MQKRTIVYEDHNGEEQIEDHYFNISVAEFIKMEISTKGGMIANTQALIDAKDGGEIIRIFDQIIEKAYGDRSEDGKLLSKEPEHFKHFKATGCYDALFAELLQEGEDGMSEFIKGIVPLEAAAKMEAKMAEKRGDRPAPKDHLKAVTASES